jgi:hypothetical protein
MILYEKIDPAVRDLCLAINEFPDIRTSNSCQGFIDGHRPGEPWTVFFRPQSLPSLEAYASIEFLASLKRQAAFAGFDVLMSCNSGPPYLNGIGRSLYFVLTGSKGHPAAFAELVRDAREMQFSLPS